MKTQQIIITTKCDRCGFTDKTEFNESTKINEISIDHLFIGKRTNIVSIHLCNDCLEKIITYTIGDFYKNSVMSLTLSTNEYDNIMNSLLNMDFIKQLNKE